MNYLRNSRSLLSRLIRRPPPPPGITHHYHVSSQSRLLPRQQRHSPSPWHHDPRKVTAAMGLAAAGAAIAARLRYGETVPFTGRTHLVVLSHREGREIAESKFAKFKTERASQILDGRHPDTVHVRRIGSEIVTAAHCGFAMIDSKKTKKKKHRDGLNWVDGIPWEVIIVRDDRVVSADCYPGAGKIVVYTGLLHYFKTDAEIAYVLAHEVGHVIARHTSEMISWWLRPIIMILPFLYLPVLPLFRRREVEADHIGMLLLAAAGYDPRAAPRFWRKVEEIEAYQWYTMMDKIVSYLGVHPASRKRWQFLLQPKIMEEALELYKQAASAVHAGA